MLGSYEIVDKVHEGQIYQHFKGGLYYVRGLATDTETGNQMVVYQSVDGQNQGKMWVREYSYFRSPVTRDGETYVRFRLITDVGETEKLQRLLTKYVYRSIKESLYFFLSCFFTTN